MDRAQENRIRVLLVDDHEVTRSGVRRMLELEDDLEVVGEASSGEEVPSLAQSLSPDIILMDLQMASMNGLDTTRLLKQRQLPGEVLVFSFYAEYLPHALEAGAGGYLLKDVRREELVESIRRVHRGELVIASSIKSTPGATEAALKHLQGAKRSFQDQESTPPIPTAGSDAMPASSSFLTTQSADAGREPQTSPTKWSIDASSQDNSTRKQHQPAQGGRVSPRAVNGGHTPRRLNGASTASEGRAQEAAPEKMMSETGTPPSGHAAGSVAPQPAPADQMMAPWEPPTADTTPAHDGEGATGTVDSVGEAQNETRPNAPEATSLQDEPPASIAAEDEETQNGGARSGYEDVELIIPPPVSAAQLSALYHRLTGDLQAQIMQTMGSFKGGARIQLLVSSDPPIQDFLERMPEVASVRQEPAHQRDGNHRKDAPDNTPAAWSGMSWRVVLKESTDPKQLALGL